MTGGGRMVSWHRITQQYTLQTGDKSEQCWNRLDGTFREAVWACVGFRINTNGQIGIGIHDIGIHDIFHRTQIVVSGREGYRGYRSLSVRS